MWLLFNAHYGFALMALVLAPFYVMSSYVNKGRLAELVKEERKAADIWVQEYQVMINSKVSIGLNRAFPYIMDRFEKKKDSFYIARNRQHLYLLITKELPRMINTLALLIVLIAGGNLVVSGQLTVGTLLFVTQLIGLIFEPLAEIASLQADLMSQKPIFQRGKDFAALPDGDTAAPADRKEGESGEGNTDVISLKNVSILRPDGSRLVQIDDFTARGPGLILIRGENGCGKSTLFNIFSGVFSEKQLEMGAGGKYNISDEYRDSLGYLFYPNFIFAGTVKENVLYGRDIPDREFERVHKLLNLPPADKEVRIKPENLSLGEKQKIYLARLLLGDYRCLFLDEPGGNLDDRTEENLIQTLDEMKHSRLLLVISHNDRYDRIADRIYTIRDGRMAMSLS
ncbi:MAG: ABC transporter ATP-binding protein [Lachnospiraceae bacterium]|nr:ABC transporter ATP-binding protein [Lachnospiraceae bacterium]